MSDAPELEHDGALELEREPAAAAVGGFIAPHRMPVDASALAVPDDAGVGWVLARVETVHGSHVAFLTPDVADAYAEQLARAASRARLLVV